MSSELYVFLNRTDLPSVAIWQAAIDGSGIKIELDSSFNPLSNDGFVPCKFSETGTGFEFSLSSKDDLLGTYPDLRGVTERYDTVAGFTWGGDLTECAAAISAAGTLANLSQGIMYDPQGDLRFRGSEALDYAHTVLAEILE